MTSFPVSSTSKALIMPLCTVCTKPCSLSATGKYSTARTGSLGRYVQPGQSVLSDMQKYVLDNPSESFSRSVLDRPLCSTDLFCIDEGCLYIRVSEIRKRDSHQVSKDENERKRKTDERNNCILSGVSISSFYHRNKFDRIRTSADQLNMLLSSITPTGVVADICGGQRDVIYQIISQGIAADNNAPQGDDGAEAAVTTCVTNDLNHIVKSHYHMDASLSDFVKTWGETVAEEHRMVDWVITSPPYGANASKCVMSALKLARRGVAMKLRITFLEPCADRIDLLKEHPINLLIPMRRDSNRGKSNDNVCEGWFVWYLSDLPTTARHGIRVL